MGLDIHLYKYEDVDSTTKREQEWEEYSNKLWEDLEKNFDFHDHNEIPSEERDKVRNLEIKKAEELGLNTWGMDTESVERIELDHAIHKDHLFKIGYFRSSYNSSGIDSLLSNSGYDELYKLFNKGDDEYRFKPQWETSLLRVQSLLDELSEKENFFRVKKITPNLFSKPSVRSEWEALDVYIKELDKDASFPAYSNSDGTFYRETPLEIHGIIEGIDSSFGKDKPCTYLILKDEGTLKWMREAVEIIRDTILYVLGQEDKDKYILHWSG